MTQPPGSRRPNEAVAAPGWYFLAAWTSAWVTVGVVFAAGVAVTLGAYDRMRRQIEASYRVLRERDALERELSVAREVQRELLPREAPPIADVSGKGVSAALLMASLQASMRSRFPTADTPGSLAADLNQALYGSSSAARYATVFLATFDRETRRLSYTNAGHLPAILIQDEDTARCDEGGVPIGMFEGVAYETGARTLAPGDLLALFTDGITEAPAPHGEEFGATRLAELLRAHRGRPLDTVIEIVLDALVQWSGPVDAHDDVTLVLARVR